MNEPELEAARRIVEMARAISTAPSYWTNPVMTVLRNAIADYDKVKG